ncbi:hypothetical protein ACI78Q_19295 [Geodermatophilus sp. SYSU D00705]
MLSSLIALAGRRDPFLARTREKFLWQCGVHEVREFFDAFAGTSDEELVPRLSIPVLALSGEGESEGQRPRRNRCVRGCPDRSTCGSPPPPKEPKRTPRPTIPR